MNDFTIGALAKQAKVHVETLRYYERRGLLAKPRRTFANYRLYTGEALQRVRFVKQAQELGFSLKEIKALLALRAAPRARCADVKKYAGQKIVDIDSKICSLTRMREALSKLQKECSGAGPISRCPILATLETERCPDGDKPKSKR
jgi:MerR family transcriptional regulator, copper efflux regulator